ncbi:YqaE/Pmp3 family membrane protein [Erythrobacter sp. HA6-11]
MGILALILTILLPPLGVAMKHGLSGTFWINVILTILGYIPGIIHGLYVNLSGTRSLA